MGTWRSGTASEHPRALRRSPKGGRPRYTAGPRRRGKPKHFHRGHPVPALETSQPSGARAKNERSESGQGSQPRETIERRATSENPLRATTINDFAKLGTALGGRPTIVERLPRRVQLDSVEKHRGARPTDEVSHVERQLKIQVVEIRRSSARATRHVREAFGVVDESGADAMLREALRHHL